MLASVGDMWIKTPPMTQIYVGSSLFATLATFLLNKNAWPEFLNLDWGAVLTKFQFWRPFTSFLFFGPLGLNYLLTIHFVWTYMAQLEKLNYKKPEEFFVMMVFGALSLLTGYTLTGLSPKFLGHNLSTFLVYIWARIFEGTDVNVMDLFFLKAELLPWFFSAQTLILEGEVPFADLLGIVVGHLYHYLTKNNILKVPDAVKGLFASPSLKARYESFKGDFE
jgi:Derlin-2/3